MKVIYLKRSSQPNNLTDNQVTDLLYRNIEDDLEIGDCIFVFGRVVQNIDYQKLFNYIKKEELIRFYSQVGPSGMKSMDQRRFG
jgi:hypothetical protein